MMMLQILKSVDFTKTQKSRYLDNEIKFFLQKKIKKLVIEVTFKSQLNL